MERTKVSLNDAYWMPGWFRVFHQFFYYLIVVPLAGGWLLLINSLWVLNHQLVRRGKKGILISNHSLIMDPAIVNMAIWPRRSAYSIKETLLNRRPVLNLFLRSLGGFPIHFGKLRELDGAVDSYLSEYGFVHFFPEGHHGFGFQNQQINLFNSGAFYFAMKLNMPVMPIVIVHFARRIFGLELKYLPRRVLVVHLDPIDPAPYLASHENMNKAASSMAVDVRQIMQNCIDEYHRRRDRRYPR